MYWNTIYRKLLIICFAIKMDYTTAVRITTLTIPPLSDPRSSLPLLCAYDMDGEELHSVKWYKDEQEFFRYTPRQQPHVMSFPVAGVHLEAQGAACDARQCSVRLGQLTTQHSGGVYKCEVSTEAPKFRVGFRAGNVTVAAVGRERPVVEGVRGVYAAGDLVQASCTAAAADPPPTLTWLLNGVHISTGPQRVSTPDPHGLVVASRDLRFHVELKHFPLPDHLLRVVCVATPPPGVPAPPLTSPPLTARLLDPQASTHQQQESNQQLAWPSSTDRNAKIKLWLSALAICLLLL